jgi:hypothetical protein
MKPIWDKGKPVNDLIQSEQDRHLNKKLQAGSCRGRAILFIDGVGLIHLLLLGNLVCLSLVLVLNLLQLRLHHSIQFCESLLLDLQRRHEGVHNDCEQNDRQTYVRYTDFADDKVNAIHQNTEDLSHPSNNEPCTFGQCDCHDISSF